MAFLAHMTSQAKGFGGNRYQIKCSAGNFLNTEMEMKFHLKAFCKLCEKMRSTDFLAVHGKICGGFL